jgi:hypothetical protein
MDMTPYGIRVALLMGVLAMLYAVDAARAQGPEGCPCWEDAAAILEAIDDAGGQVCAVIRSGALGSRTDAIKVDGTVVARLTADFRATIARYTCFLELESSVFTASAQYGACLAAFQQAVATAGCTQ